MDLRPTAEQQQLVEAFADLFADHATPEVVQAAEVAEPTGHDSVLWRRLLDMGAVDMALPDGVLGSASLLDLALVAEQHGRFLAPSPMVEVQTAARLLERAGAFAAVVDPAELSSGSRLITIAVRSARDGRAQLVPAAAVADDALILVGDRLVLAPLQGQASPVANLANLPLADVTLTGNEPVLASGPEAGELVAGALDEWRVLMAAALSGLAARALEIGVAYVKERKAFGRPVGQFQAVAHRLADRAAEVEGAELLAREAAWAAEAEPDRARSLAAMALAFSAETAISTSHDALHFHGGYGFMLEYPIQLYYRRARGWAAVLESPADGYRRVAAEHLASQATEGAA